MNAEAEQAAEWAKEREAWDEYRRLCRAATDAAKSAGEPLPDHLPHPDDIVIGTSGPVHFIGPVDEDSAKRIQQTIAMRDLLILQAELDEREQRGPNRAGRAMLLAITLDKSLPPRLRLSDVIWISKMMRAAKTPKRHLLKTLFSGWRSLGVRVRRGVNLPDQDIVVAKLKFAYQAFEKFQSGELDVDAISRGEFDESAKEFFSAHGIPLGTESA